jgi:hypothetical protein
MIRIVRVTAAEMAMTPTPASTRCEDMRLLALLVVVAARDGDGAIFDRAERPGGDILATAGLTPGHAEPCGGAGTSGLESR